MAHRLPCAPPAAALSRCRPQGRPLAAYPGFPRPGRPRPPRGAAAACERGGTHPSGGCVPHVLRRNLATLGGCHFPFARRFCTEGREADRESVGEGKRVERGGRRISKRKR